MDETTTNLGVISPELQEKLGLSASEVQDYNNKVTGKQSVSVSQNTETVPRELQELHGMTDEEAVGVTDDEYEAVLTTALQRAKQSNQTESNRGVIKDVAIGIGTGISNAVEQTLHTIADLGDWLDNNVADLGEIRWSDEGSASFKDIDVPDLGETETFAGGATQAVTQFVAGFLGAGKLLTGVKALTTTGKVTKAAAQGAIADFSSFDPYEDRLSNLIQSQPALENPITEYLAASEDDEALEGRFKQSLEGLGLGVAAEGLFKAVRLIKQARKVKADVTQIASDLTPTQAVDNVGSEIADDIAPAQLTDNAEPIPRAEDEVTLNVTDDVNTIKDDSNVSNNIEAAGTQSRAAMVRIKDDQAAEFQEAILNDDIDTALTKADFNFDNIESTADVKQLFQQTSEFFASNIDEAKRGRISHEQTAELAEMIGKKWDEGDTFELGRNVRGLDSQVLVSRSLLVKSAEKTRELAMAAKGGDQAALLALRKHIVVHTSIQAQVKGVQSEIARALGAMKINANSDMARAAQIDQVLNDMDGKIDAALANKLATADDIQVNKLIRRSLFTKTIEALHEYWVAMLLSSPATHMVNLTSNALVTINGVAERKLGAMFSSARIGIANATGRQTPEDVIAHEEATQMLYGFIQGSKDALRLASKEGKPVGTVYQAAYQNRGITDPVLKHEHYSEKISSESLGFDENSLKGKTVDAVGKVVRMPFRVLGAADEYFKTINTRMHLNSLALRQAKSKGLKGADLDREVAKLVDEPSEEMLTEAIQYARTATFTDELSPQMKTLNSLRQSNIVFRTVVPFLKTPANIVRWTYHRTPGINMLMGQIKEDFAAGGSRRDMALSKTTMGASLYATAGMLVAAGKITGAFPENERKARLANGEMEYSFVFTNDEGEKEYLHFGRTDPFAMFFGIAADAHAVLASTDDEITIDEVTSGLVAAVYNNVLSKTWMSGISDVLAALDQPERQGSYYIQNLLKTFAVPRMVSWLRKEVDPHMRETITLLDTLKNEIPWLSNELAIKYSALGEPITYKDSLMFAFNKSEGTNDPIYNMMTEVGYHPSKIPTSIDGVELTGPQHSAWEQKAGQNALPQLYQYSQNPDFLALDSDTKKEWISKAFRDGRARAKSELINNDEELKAAIILAREEEQELKRQERIENSASTERFGGL